jgi:AraC-like DNA-binding protein
MLTACSLDEQRIEGYNCGADGYMAKPFNSELLISQVNSLITNRKRIKDISAIKVEPATPKSTAAKVGDIDNEFIAKLKKLIDEEMSDADLNVEELGQRMGVSRVQLYRKVKALTQYTPVELLRIMRLKKAASLIASTEDTIAEIAYHVGFSSPGYFAKCYKEYFGELPTEHQARTSKINS